MLSALVNGICWRDLPPWQTASYHFRRWQAFGALEQGNLLGVWVSSADVSDAQGAYEVLEGVLVRYRSVRVVRADGT